MQYTGMMLLEEMVSIFLTPFLLVFIVPEVGTYRDLISSHFTVATFFQSPIFLFLQRVDDILQFIADFTVHIEGVGHVCRLFCYFSSILISTLPLH